MTTLVTGGAGYIGSHTVRQLVNAGRDVVVFDSLELGHREALLGTELVVAILPTKISLHRCARNMELPKSFTSLRTKALGNQ